jgi:hypothetical protein
MIVMFQMLLSVTYTVIIFSQGMAHFSTPYILPDNEDEDEEEGAEENEPLV